MTRTTDLTSSAATAAALLGISVLSTIDTVPAALAAGSLSTLTLLGLAHVGLWPYRDRIPRPASYVVGVGCAGVGIALISALLDTWVMLIAFVAVFGPGSTTSRAPIPIRVWCGSSG